MSHRLVDVVPAGGRAMPASLNMLDVPLRNVAMRDAVAEIADAAAGDRLAQFAFVNADCLNRAVELPQYRALLAAVRAVFADGSGIRMATRIFTPFAIRDNVNGTDMFPLLCDELARRGRSLFLLGAAPGVAEAVAVAAKSRCPDLVIAGTHHGMLGETDHARVVARVNASGADVLLVAMGAPRQEFWIARHARELDVAVAIGVGGLFDFVSGNIPRAPAWLRRMGLEWTFRLRQEPARMWRRYLLGNPRFLWRAWRWSRRGNPLAPPPAHASGRIA